ncbi:MAG: hypothetical protein ACJASR_000142 [Psychroserpens sp.]|jgi:hypothetical protein
MENEGKKLSLVYNKNIIFPGSINKIIEKECIVRKKPNQYAIITLDNIRYVIFEDKKNYTILGRKMDGGKFKNYFLSELSLEKMMESMPEGEKIEVIDMEMTLKNLFSDFDDHKEVFLNHVKDKYNITYKRAA